jgi:putative Mg2+ transporter-C (MgtC) family protein
MLDIMPVSLTWDDIASRLLLTVVAGSIIGINREAGGHAAGFRTTVLVGLAACLTMIQANLLLSVVGKTEHSFSVMDTLRLPLGVLTGVGFIGGGAILKRGDMIAGVTTAATLWIMTAIGLCIGGGQLVLGCSGAVLALVVLLPFKTLDDRLPRPLKARVVVASDKATAGEIEEALREYGVRARFVSRQTCDDGTRSVFELRWRSSARDNPEVILAQCAGKFPLASFEVTGLEA